MCASISSRSGRAAESSFGCPRDQHVVFDRIRDVVALQRAASEAFAPMPQLPKISCEGCRPSARNAALVGDTIPLRTCAPVVHVVRLQAERVPVRETGTARPARRVLRHEPELQQLAAETRWLWSLTSSCVARSHSTGAIHFARHTTRKSRLLG